MVHPHIQSQQETLPGWTHDGKHQEAAAQQRYTSASGGMGQNGWGVREVFLHPCLSGG